MKFYDILQWDPQVSKNMLKKSTDKKEQLKLKLGMFLRSLLIVLFAILFISTLSNIFGNENSPMAVAIFCILLGVRFVDFGYCIKDSMLNLGLVFLMLLFSPVIAYKVNPIFGVLIHFISFFIILFMTCDKPEMGNGGLFSFAYIYLSGNPVYGEVLYRRFLLTLVGFLICGIIFYVKHKDKFKNVRFIDKVKEFDLYNHVHQWIIRMSLGVALILTLGVFLNIERFMWAGFACGSLLSDYSENPQIHERLIYRFIGMILGSLIFYVVYLVVPSDLFFIIGPLGGFCLGFCTEYKYKTAANCLGALMLATGIYGVHSAIAIRIIDTLIGILFAWAYYYLYEFFIGKRYKADKKIVNE